MTKTAFVKNLAGILSVGLLAGLAVALVDAAHYIVLSDFVAQGLRRSIWRSLQVSLNEWVPVGAVAALALVAVWRLAAWGLSTLGRLLRPRRAAAPGSATAARWARGRVYGASFAFFAAAGFLLNHYYLPHKFDLISLASDAVLLLVVAASAYVFVRLGWTRLCGPLTKAALAPVAVLVLANLFVAVGSRIGLPQGPNVVIVLMDTLRRDHLSCYGCPRETSPNIDRFARSATLFRNMYSQSPSTKPSVASIFTSRYPTQHQIIFNESALNLSHFTLAECFYENKYQTAGFIENPVLSKELLFNQGFTTWKLDDLRAGFTPLPGDRFLKSVLDWLDRRSHRPFFLYVHFMDPHGPYRAPDGFHGFFDKDYRGSLDGNTTKFSEPQYFYDNPRELEHIVALYDEEIRYVDSQFGAILDRIDQLGLSDNTVVILTADHGEGFLEHGYFFHSQSVYSELIDVPLIVRYPGVFDACVVETPVQHIDLAPTVATLADLDTGAFAAEGDDLTALAWDSTPTLGSRFIVTEHLREKGNWGIPQRSIVSGDWKLVHSYLKGAYELFQTSSDPNNQRNVAEEHAPVAEMLKKTLEDWFARLGDLKQAGEIELNDEMVDQLRALGYLR